MFFLTIYYIFKLECFIGISSTEKIIVSLHMKNCDNLMFFEMPINYWHITHNFYLAPQMNGDNFCFWKVNEVDFLLVRCLIYNKKNNTWLFGDMEYLFLFLCLVRTCEILRWSLKEKFHVSTCPCIILYYTLSALLYI